VQSGSLGLVTEEGRDKLRKAPGKCM